MSGFPRLPTVPTHTPVFIADEDIRNVLSDYRNVMKFVDYLLNSQCKPYCIDSQKQYIEKYSIYQARSTFARNPSVDTILYDLEAFCRSRGTSLQVEFAKWIRSLSDIEFRLVSLQTPGRARRTRRNRRARRTRRTRRA